MMSIRRLPSVWGHIAAARQRPLKPLTHLASSHFSLHSYFVFTEKSEIASSFKGAGGKLFVLMSPPKKRARASTPEATTYIGVRPRGKKYGAEAYDPKGKKNFWIGTFDTEEEAARAHDRKAFELQGENAALNFPNLVDKAPSSLPLSSSPTPHETSLPRRYSKQPQQTPKFLNIQASHTGLMPSQGDNPSHSTAAANDGIQAIAMGSEELESDNFFDGFERDAGGSSVNPGPAGNGVHSYSINPEWLAQEGDEFRQLVEWVNSSSIFINEESELPLINKGSESSSALAVSISRPKDDVDTVFAGIEEEIRLNPNTSTSHIGSGVVERTSGSPKQSSAEEIEQAKSTLLGCLALEFSRVLEPSTKRELLDALSTLCTDTSGLSSPLETIANQIYHELPKLTVEFNQYQKELAECSNFFNRKAEQLAELKKSCNSYKEAQAKAQTLSAEKERLLARISEIEAEKAALIEVKPQLGEQGKMAMVKWEQFKNDSPGMDERKKLAEGHILQVSSFWSSFRPRHSPTYIMSCVQQTNKN